MANNNNYFRNRYPYTDMHELNLDWVVSKTEDCVDTVSEFDDRMTAAEDDISGLKTRMTAAEGNITDLQGRMTTAETHIDLAEGAISDLQTAVSGAGDDISALGDRLTIVENQQETDGHAISELISDVQAAEQDIDNLQTDMTQAQLDIDAAELDIDALQTATTRTGVPLQWASTKGTQSGEIDLQKYGKIRVLYMHGIVENITTAITSGSGSGALMMSATLPEDSAPLENMQMLIPVDMTSSPYCGLLLLKIGTDRSVEVYNYSHVTFGLTEDSPTFYFNATYMIS